jgi:hypothetical protein
MRNDKLGRLHGRLLPIKSAVEQVNKAEEQVTDFEGPRESGQNDLEKGYKYISIKLNSSYLKKFKALSQAFTSGEFRNISHNAKDDFTNSISKV